MKGSCTILASALAASTMALTSSSSSGDRNAPFQPSSSERFASASSSRAAVSGKDEFRPRFDGLRFIETLVTAHR